jgi:hypothetical protein
MFDEIAIPVVASERERQTVNCTSLSLPELIMQGTNIKSPGLYSLEDRECGRRQQHLHSRAVSNCGLFSGLPKSMTYMHPMLRIMAIAHFVLLLICKSFRRYTGKSPRVKSQRQAVAL